MIALQLKLTDLIDSTWTIALERADAAGKELAEVGGILRIRTIKCIVWSTVLILLPI